jgi:hypothetical protein
LSDFPQLGLDEADVLDLTRAASPVDLEQLLLSLERVLEVVSAKDTFIEAKGLPGKLSVVKKRYADDLASLMTDLKDGAVTPKEFEKQARPLVSQNFRQAFELGRGSKATEGDEEWLKRAVDSEVGYARDLAGQVAKGSEITPDARANRYAAALDGVSWNGKVESMPDDTVIHWRLGCLTSNSFTVITLHDIVPLEQVEIGALVLTHEGRFRKVLAKPVNRSTENHRYAVLVAEGGVLVGLTDDHRILTARGWVTAREVAGGKDKGWSASGNLSGVRKEGGQAIDQVQGVLFQDSREEASAWAGGRSGGRFQARRIRSILCADLDRQTVDASSPSSLDMGEGERQTALGETDPSCERGLLGRPIGEPGADDEGGAQQGSPYWGEVGKGLAELEGWKDDWNLRALRGEVRGIRPSGRQAEILLDGMQGQGGDCFQGSDIDLRAMQSGVQQDHREDRVGTEKREQKKFLLSRLLEGSEARCFDGDPVVRLLQEDLLSLAVEDREVEIGDVVLLASVLESGQALYDLTIDEDHSFVIEGMIIHNSAEHCPSCVILASHSPYDKFSLPTTPRAGDTDCRMWCHCKLVFEQGDGAGEPKSGVFGIDAYLNPDEIPVPKQGQGLLDWLRPPEPPEGLRLPVGAERLAVDGMFAEVNYFRRVMSQIDDEMDPEGFLEAAAARKEANARLIDYMEQRSIWDRPQLSVDDVITGKDIPLLAERELFEQGISGEALADENVAREVSKLVDRYRLDVGKKFK